MTVGKVRPALAGIAGYRPGKDASQAEEEHGITGAIKLASNENPWPPVAAVVAAIQDAANSVNRYGDNAASAVAAAIAEWTTSGSGARLDALNISVGCGSSGVLQQLMLTYVDPGNEVVFPWPSFEIYPVFCTIFGAVAVRTGFDDYGFDLNAVADAVTNNTSIVFLATPNNPTGTAVSCDEIGQLLDRIPDDVMVVVDEAYREFSDPALGDPVVELLPQHRNLVVTRTFSKAFGLAGLRTGYAIADPEVVSQIDSVRLAFSVNSLAQAGTLAAIEHADEALERVALLRQERERMFIAVTEAGMDVVPSHANFLFFPTGDRTAEIAFAMEKQGVVVRPFARVGLRVTIGTPEQNDRWLAALLAATR